MTSVLEIDCKKIERGENDAGVEKVSMKKESYVDG